MDDAPPPRRRRWLVPVLVALAVCAGAWWLTRDVDITGHVSGMRWSHTTQVQRWQDVARSGWRDDLDFTAAVPPVRGAGEVPAVLVTACAPRYHHEESYDCGTETIVRREEYRCGSERRCERVRREVDGRARRVDECKDVPRRCLRELPTTRPKICKRVVYADWCDYLTQEWVPVRSERIEGDAHLGLRFADLTPAGDFERTRKDAVYTLTLQGPGGDPHTAVVTRDEYDGWNLGDPVVLRTEAIGGVLGFGRPAGSGAPVPSR